MDAGTSIDFTLVNLQRHVLYYPRKSSPVADAVRSGFSGRCSHLEFRFFRTG